MNRVTMVKNKHPTRNGFERTTKKTERRTEENGYWMVIHSSWLSITKTVKPVYLAILVMKILTLASLKLLKKESTFKKGDLLFVSILWQTNIVLATEG